MICQPITSRCNPIEFESIKKIKGVAVDAATPFIVKRNG
jgi:hypothetical protein